LPAGAYGVSGTTDTLETKMMTKKKNKLGKGKVLNAPPVFTFTPHKTTTLLAVMW